MRILQLFLGLLLLAAPAAQAGVCICSNCPRQQEQVTRSCCRHKTQQKRTDSVDRSCTCQPRAGAPLAQPRDVSPDLPVPGALFATAPVVQLEAPALPSREVATRLTWPPGGVPAAPGIPLLL